MGTLFDDDANQLINCGSAVALDNIFSDGGTFMFWTIPTGWGDLGFGRVCSKTGSGSQGGFIILQNTGAQGALRLFSAQTGTDGSWQTNNSTLSVGTPAHCAVVYDNSNNLNNPLLYIDSVSMTVNETVGPPTGAPYDDAANDFILGNRVGFARSLDALLWDVRVYDRLVPADEILSIFTARGKDSNVTGLQGRWPLFGETDQIPGAGLVLDTTGASPGTESGSVTYQEDPNAGHW